MTHHGAALEVSTADLDTQLCTDLTLLAPRADFALRSAVNWNDHEKPVRAGRCGDTQSRCASSSKAYNSASMQDGRHAYGLGHPNAMATTGVAVAPLQQCLACSQVPPASASSSAAVPRGQGSRPLSLQPRPSTATSPSGAEDASARLDPVILHLTGMRSMKYGGFERYLVEVAQRCSAQGFRLVIQHNTQPTSARYVADLRAAGAVVVVQALDAGRFSSAFEAVRLIAKCRPVLVHLHFCHSWTRLFVGLFAVRFGVSRTVATVHLMPSEESRLLLRASYSRVDRILAVSHAVERALLMTGVPPAALVTHYLGVPELGPLPHSARHEIRAQFGIPDSSPVLVTILFNNRMKGVDVLVAAFTDHLAAECPDLHQLVVGMTGLEEMAGGSHTCSQHDRLHWAGIQDDIRPFLAASDIYIQPSRVEGLPLAIMEAMRQSLPVVATKVGGIPEAVVDGETGVLVLPDSPSELAAAVTSLLADPGLTSRLGRAGHERWRSRFRLTQSIDDLVTEHYGLPAF